MFVFPHFIMAVIMHVKCDAGSGLQNNTYFEEHLGMTAFLESVL